MKSLLNSILVLFLVYANPSFAQVEHNAQIKIKSIRVNDNIVTKSMWNSLNIGSDDKVSFTFLEPGGIGEKVLYKIFLNGKIINPGQPQLNDGIIFDHLNNGAYILKVQAYTASGIALEPLVQQFLVQEEMTSPVVVSESSSNFIDEYINIYTLGGLCVIQLLIILILLLRRKKGEGGNRKTLKYDELVEELSDYKYSYKRLKEEIQNQKDENDYLKKQMKELNKTIKDLEKANVQLLEQKERLVDSKFKLEELQAQKEQLFAMAIHDIKNPAAVIKSSLELLNSYDLNANEQQELMSSIMASSKNLVELSHQMCTIIAKNKPEPTLTFEEGSIKKIIDTVCLHNMSYAKAKNIKLFNKASASLPDITMDVIKVEEAIDNLVNNAIKYGPPSTVVEVISYLKNNKIVVEVKDTGCGLSEEDLKKVFQKGATLSTKPTGVEQSSGLGLWLVKKIIDEHNGKVWVDSKQDKGSTFALELPVIDEEENSS